ncbi:MAG: dihydroorotase family protein [Polyangiaceae bacterium]|jgi:allantoinase|nr:dihydroorotase family protein [Polyangiaceae bacterium]
MTTQTYDTLVKNVRVVRPKRTSVDCLDIAIKQGKFARLAPEIRADQAKQVIDGKNLLAFPGVIDPHMHIGIYTPLPEDAKTESRAAAMGGVTSGLTYFRTGQYYLNKGGPYRDFYPEVLRLSEGNFHMDYGFHLAPVTPGHIDEMEMLLTEFGVCTFKAFMFYGSHGLHGRSSQQHEFLMIDEDHRYDISHFERAMRQLARVAEARPELRDFLSFSLHCETPELLTAHTRAVEELGELTGLRAYSAARPPQSEGLSVLIAGYLAHVSGCPNINLLHLTSKRALEAARIAVRCFPNVQFGREVTVGHLSLDVDCENGNYAKVNPPVRERSEVEALWQAVLAMELDWVGSDHACCREALKLSKDDPDNIFRAKSGFGGTEYLLSGLHTGGSKRGMSYNHMAELTSYNASRRFGLLQKGDIAEGLDADLVLFDPSETFVVHPAESESAQEYSPFAGMELTGRVKSTFLRGNLIYDKGQVLGQPQGRYLKRPTLR